MRTKNFLRMLAAAFVAMTFSYSFSQSLTTTNQPLSTDVTSGGEVTNYVTVGAEVPFATTSTLPIWQLKAQGIISDYVWKWETSGAGATWYQADGSTALTPVTTLGVEDLTGLNFFPDSVVAIKFASTGAHTLTLTERTVSNTAAITGCEGSPVTLDVQVVNAPTVVYNDADRILGGCGADVAADNNIPITISGSGLFTSGLQVTYRIEYKSLSAAAFSDVVASGTIANDGSEFTSGWAAFSVNNGVTNAAIAFNITDGNFGTYRVTLQGVTDVISRKSLNAKVNYELDGLPAAAARVLTYYALPTPTTQSIKHIKNNW